MDRFGRGWFWWGCFGISIFFLTLFQYTPITHVFPLPAIIGFARLGEFGLGMVFGWRLATIQPARWWRWWPLALIAWVGGTYFPMGPVAPLLIGLGATALAVPVAGAVAGVSWLTWIGRRSLEIFLIHDLVRFAYGSWPIANSWLTQWPFGFVLYSGAIAILSIGLATIDDALIKRYTSSSAGARP